MLGAAFVRHPKIIDMNGPHDNAPLAASPACQPRVLAEQLRLTSRQAARFPLPVAVIDVFVVWLFWREGLAAVAVAWFALRVLLQLITTWKMRALQRRLDAGSARPRTLSAGRNSLCFCSA